MRGWRVLMVALIAFGGTWALGIDEQDYGKQYRGLVTPLFSAGTSGELQGRGGVRLRYRFFPRSEGKGAVVLVPGYSESYLKYPETIYDLWSRGYSVYVMDHRGMGLSARETRNPQVVHIRRFQDYVDDLQNFVDNVVSRDHLEKKFVVAHSFGALVAAHLVKRRPHLFKAAAFSAPLFEVETGKYPMPVARALARGAVLLGQGEKYAFGFSDLDLNAYTFETNRNTHSRARFEAHRETLQRVPQIHMGGPSFQWVSVMLDETTPYRVRALARGVKTPVLLFQAETDIYVRPGGQNLFCRTAAICERVAVPGSFHELFRETDNVRDGVLEKIVEFFGRHAAP